MAILRNAASCAIIVCATFLLSAPATAEPQNGWWWNPNESGRGYFIEMTGGVFYLAGYFYDTNGRATWMSASGAVTDLYSITGTLQSYRNGQSMFGAYRRPDPAVDVGTISISFKDDSHGTMTWPGGTVSIERQVFDTDESFEELPKTGWWWSPAESGSGYSVEIQGSTLFVVAFMYDESGNPLWYLTAGALSSPTHYEGDWLEYSGGQTMAGPYRSPTSRNLGRVAIDFAAFDAATITFTEAATGKQVQKGSTKSSKAGPRSRGPNPIGPQLTGPTWGPGYGWPHFYCQAVDEFKVVDGTFEATSHYNYVLHYRLLANTDNLYLLDGSRSYVDVTYDSKDTHPNCTSHGSRRIDDLRGQLDIRSDLAYRLQVFETYNGFLNVTESCQDLPDTTTQRVTAVRYAVGGYRSHVQGAIPYQLPLSPSVTRPYFRVFDQHREPDGSGYTTLWNCSASEAD